MDILETFRAKTQRRDVAWFTFFLISGLLLISLAILQPVGFVVLVVAVIVISCIPWVVVRARQIDLELWQWMLLIALTGYMLFNYGFENVTIHIGGLPFIVSYGLMYGCLALAAYEHPTLMAKTFKDPGMLCLGVLILQTFVHLYFDLPRYKLWAIRDATMFLDGIFLTLGLLWAMKWNNIVLLMKWLAGYFIVNLLYSYTLPWGQAISGISPKSGVFNQVALFGSYWGNAEFLLFGTFFCLFLAKYVVRWPRWMLILLAVAQLFGLAITQARAMYVALFVSLIVLLFVGKAKQSLQVMLILLLAMIPLLLLTVSGIQLRGRIGEVNMDFITQHMRSITGARATPGMSNDDRLDWFEQGLQHFYKHPWFGVGFGSALIDAKDAITGAPIRMPHNSTITVMARLGASGFLFWAIFLLYVFWQFIYAIRRRGRGDKQLDDIILWLFLFFIAFMIGISCEPGLEFPSGSVPFYFFLGLALGVIRWQFRQAWVGVNSSAMRAPDVGLSE